MDPLFPFVQVPPPASHGASATAAFYKALETGVPHNGRRVKIDYSQSALPDKARGRQNMNDGTRDIGNTQGPVLLFRGLNPLSGPQAIAQAMMNSAGPGQSGAKGMKRIILIKDRVTLASFGFAFVEFIDAQVTRGGVIQQWFLIPLSSTVCGFSAGCHHVSSDSPFRLSNFRQACRRFFCSSILIPAS